MITKRMQEGFIIRKTREISEFLLTKSNWTGRIFRNCRLQCNYWYIRYQSEIIESVIISPLKISGWQIDWKGILSVPLVICPGSPVSGLLPWYRHLMPYHPFIKTKYSMILSSDVGILGTNYIPMNYQWESSLFGVGLIDCWTINLPILMQSRT